MTRTRATNDEVVRYPALTRRDIRQAEWMGRRDGRAGLPAGEPQPTAATPGATALLLRWEPLLATLSSRYRAVEAGYAAILVEGARVAAQGPLPQPVTESVPAGGGPEARAARAANQQARSAQASAQAGRGATVRAAHEAADALLAHWYTQRTAALAVIDLADQSLARYTAAVLRHHPAGADLSTRGWHPQGLQPPAWVTDLRLDLKAALDALDIPYLTQGVGHHV